MRAGLPKLGITIALGLILPTALPGTYAAPPDVLVAVAVAGLDVSGVPQGFRIEQITNIDERGLGRYDVLVIDEATLDALWDHPGKRNALKKFFHGHRILAVIGISDDDPFARFALRDGGGADIPFAGEGDEPAAPAGKARVLLQTAKGIRHTLAAHYSTPGALEADFAARLTEWTATRVDFAPSGGRGHARAANNEQWQWRGTAAYAYEVYPYGVVGYEADFYRQSTETHSSYDWWNVVMWTRSDPGTSKWYTSWYTYKVWTTSDVNYYNTQSHQLVDYGHPSANAWDPTTISFEAGMRSGVEDAPFTSTYGTAFTTEDTNLYQGSSMSFDDFYASREVAYASLYTMDPKDWPSIITIRTSQSQCLKIPFTNKVEWENYDTGAFYQTWINSWREVC